MDRCELHWNRVKLLTTCDILMTSFCAAEKQKSPWLSVNSVQQQLNHLCISIILIQNPKHNTILATMKKILTSSSKSSKGPLRWIDFLSNKEKLGELGLFTLVKRRPMGNVIKPYRYLTGGSEEDGARHFLVVPKERTRGNRPNLKNRKFHLIITINFFYSESG